MGELADSSRGIRDQILPRDRIVAELASDGVVGHKELRSRGISKHAVHRGLASGRLHVVLPGVYAVGHSALSWRGRLRAAVLWGGEDAVLSHLTAAGLWDLLLSASPTVHITVPRGGKTSRAWIRAHHARQIDRAEVNGFPVTTVERTLVDLAPMIRPDRLERAVEQAVRMDRLDFGAMKTVRSECRGRRGLAALDAAIAAFDPLAPQTHPGIERAFLRLIRKYKLPEPKTNVQAGPYVVDFLWEEQKLIVELDSLQHHRRPGVFEADRKRDIDLKLLGYTVIRITHRRLEAEPAVVADELRYFLSACAP